MAGEMSLAAWRPTVVEALRLRYGANERTAAKVVAEAVRLFKYLAARDAVVWGDVTSLLVLEWCWAARVDRSGRHRRAAQSTARNRQWTALAALEEAAKLGAPIDPPALIGERIVRSSSAESVRPLTDDEDRLARDFGDAGLVASRRSVMLALSYAGGSASEIAAVRMGDVDLSGRTVEFSGPAARVGLLDEWSYQSILRFVRNNPQVPADALLCVSESTGLSRVAHTVTVRLGHVLKDAGLSGRPGVTARSFRLTTARRILDSHGIEAAARFLGSPSLDSTATALGYRWGQHDD